LLSKWSKRNPVRQLTDCSRSPIRQDRERLHPPRQARSLKKFGVCSLKILPVVHRKILSWVTRNHVELPTVSSVSRYLLTQRTVYP
jgi:hypothetical protein